MSAGADERGERRLLRRLRAEIAGRIEPLPTAIRRPQSAADATRDQGVPFGDDMAATESDGAGLLWTTDMLMDGVDFESGRHAWRDIGWKALAVNLSDCAAMAAAPVSALCAVSLSNRMTEDDALELLAGIRECGQAFGCPLVGGDTNSWDHPAVIAVSVCARCEPDRRPVLRSGARPGDGVYLSGPVGGSILGRHLRPVPRIAAALELNRRFTLSAMIDVSDGLSIDLWHICEESRCGAELEAALLDAAVHEDARRLAERTGRSPRDHALEDGEDFELIVALPPAVEDEARRALGLLPLGRIVAPHTLTLRETDGRLREIRPRGWEHFR